QRVELHAELGRRPRETGNLSVQHVKHHADEQGQGRPLVLAVEGQHDCVETAEEVPRRQEPGQEENRLPPALTELRPAAPPEGRPPAPPGSPPTIVWPPRTWSPALTRKRADAGTIRSVREPNLISPKRSPEASLSPGRTRQTIRRASTPAICRTT